MISRTKLFFIVVLLTGCLAPLSLAWANPLADVGPDEPIYQRVKALEKYGLLDPQDQAVLDEGKYVTRLELAFYTEKAKAMIEAPSLGKPSEPTATPMPATAPATVSSTSTVVASPTEAPTPLPYVDPRVRLEIDELLKELKSESGELKSQWSQEDQRIKDRQKEIDALNNIQDLLNNNARESNGKMKMPTFDSISRFNFEELSITGPATAMAPVPPATSPVSFAGPHVPAAPITLNGVVQAPIPSADAIRAEEIDEIHMSTDLGGVGSYTMILGAVLYQSNASALGFPTQYSQPASIYVANPDFATQLSGPLGSWNAHVAVEAYPGALSFGDFTRGVQPAFLKLDQDPFDIRRSSDDKDGKLWDDFMTNISVPQENYASGQIASTYDREFDGLYGVGNDLPFIGGDTRLTVLFGRMGTTNLQSQRWEEGAKIDSTLVSGLRGDVSAEWVNDNFATTLGGPELDLKTYQATLNYNLGLLNINAEAALSSFYTGIDNVTPSNLAGTPTNTAVEAPAGQVSISYYPLGLYYTAISDSFANMQSKVAMAGLHMNQYGLTNSPSTAMDAYGWLGEADTLVSDRYGWRVNLGWDGREQSWMKSWPSFLDAFVIDFNVSSKNEYAAEYNTLNYNVIEAINMTSLYYPDDEGLWGLNFWGGYGEGGIQNWEPVRENYITNIEAFRNDGGLAGGSDVRYQYTMSSEQVPLIMPIMNPITNMPVTNSQGFNEYYSISNLKSYNYITLTTKVQFNKLLGIASPVYGSFFFTDNSVAATPSSSDMPASATFNMPMTLSAGTKLFDQTVYDFTGMVQVVRNVNILADIGMEFWKSSYTYPLINYRTDSIGAGFAYDIPWGGAKWEFRYKHLVFSDEYVPLNDYQADQFFSTVRLLF